MAERDYLLGTHDEEVEHVVRVMDDNDRLFNVSIICNACGGPMPPEPVESMYGLFCEETCVPALARRYDEDKEDDFEEPGDFYPEGIPDEELHRFRRVE